VTDTQKLALKMAADPDLVGKTWDEVVGNQSLDPWEFCYAVHSSWIYANFAALILEGDDAKLQEFIEQVDPKRVVRAGIA